MGNPTCDRRGSYWCAIGIGMPWWQSVYERPFFAMIRPEAKKHGRQNKIEGHVEKGQSAIIIEDLISTGKSSLRAVEALKEAAVHVKGMLAIFTYGFKIAEANFENAGVSLHTLSDYENLLQLAEKSNYINASEAKILADWRINPATWANNCIVLTKLKK